MINWSGVFPAVTTKVRADESLDLEATQRSLARAIDAGVKLTIDTDAHSIDGLTAMPFGICVARRGWVKKTDVINCLPIGQLREWVARKRKRK